MLMPPRRKVLLCSCLFATMTGFGTGVVGIAANSATEAPAGLTPPSFNGAASINNGLVEPAGDTFARDQQVYEHEKQSPPDLDLYTTQLPASLATRIRIVEQPARSQNSASATTMQMVIS